MEHTLVGLAGIVVFGIAAQWLAWRTRAPAILLLLLAGFAVGGVTEWLDPDALLGDSLFPIVSLSVAIILFEGGLSLDIAELKTIGKAVRNLIAVGVLVTWFLTTLLGHALLGFDWLLAALLGAILVVTGPTVVIPLLRQIRPSAKMASIVRWEGLINDPIGAILAVLVFDWIQAATVSGGAAAAMSGIVKAIAAGTGLGLLGAALLVVLLHRHWVPDFLQSPVALAVVIAVFTLSGYVMDESGLLAVTVMGSALASQRWVSIRNILEFKENLRVLLIASLFIILAARLPLDDPVYTEAGSWLFLTALLLLVRPISVLLSSIGTTMTWKERVFLAWMAPRGIVAAAVASVFSIELTEVSYPGAERLAPVVFLVIVGTVVGYGLTAKPVARLLGVATPNPQGLLLVGASRWVRDLAKLLADRGIDTLLIDVNWNNVSRARQRGLTAHYGNILSEPVTEALPLEGVGSVLAMTPNDQVNTLIGLHMSDEFGREHVYQLVPGEGTGPRKSEVVPKDLSARRLFRPGATFAEIERRVDDGSVFKQTTLTGEFDYEAYRRMYGEEALPMFLIAENGRLTVVTANTAIKPRSGQTLVALVDEPEVSDVS